MFQRQALEEGCSEQGTRRHPTWKYSGGRLHTPLLLPFPPPNSHRLKKEAHGTNSHIRKRQKQKGDRKITATRKMARLQYVLPSLLIPASILLHLYVSPYTKVEESFNMQATHDILFHGVSFSKPPPDIFLTANYDHVSFPGAVPRTFVGAVVLSGLARPFLWLGVVGSWNGVQTLGMLFLFLWIVNFFIFFKKSFTYPSPFVSSHLLFCIPVLLKTSKLFSSLRKIRSQTNQRPIQSNTIQASIYPKQETQILIFHPSS